VFSRNAQSSRAIPVKKSIEMVENEPVIPIWWGKNEPGMQASKELIDEAKEKAKAEWCKARKNAIVSATNLSALEAHKQIINRILEPYSWITVVVSATEWANFFKLRCHPDAEPHMRTLAELMLAVYKAGTPQNLGEGEWHLPYITDEDRKIFTGKDERDIEVLKRVSVARCARVSYLGHDGTRDVKKDMELFEKLINGSGGAGHWSPLEHVASPFPYRMSNFEGWRQFRKLFIQENYVGELP